MRYVIALAVALVGLVLIIRTDDPCELTYDAGELARWARYER